MKKIYESPVIEVVEADTQAVMLTISPSDATPNSPVLSKENSFLDIDDEEE